MWGSDWPVVTTHATYEQWKTCAEALVRRLAPRHEAAVFGANATAVYSLNGRIAASGRTA
jgi:L-fuconolactonase